VSDRADVVVIVHPLRRHAAAIEPLMRQRAAAAGLRVRFEATTSQRPGAQQAAQAVADGAARVIVAGGDGTVRSVASGLAGSDAALGIIPTGTANLFARNLGIRAPRTAKALEAALRRAFAADPTPQDVGLLSWRGTDLRPRTDVFLAVAGMGEDAAIVAETDEALKARTGWPAYLLRGAARLRSPLHTLGMRVDDGPELELPAWSVLIGSAPRIPLGIRVFPHVRTDSGDLELLRAAPQSLHDWASIGWHGLIRRPQRARALHYDCTLSVELRARSPLLLQADGDLLGRAAQVRAEVSPAALLVAT
jgi:diacylglycerol kinase family enzyme